jgi:hypothetical protein
LPTAYHPTTSSVGKTCLTAGQLVQLVLSPTLLVSLLQKVRIDDRTRAGTPVPVHSNVTIGEDQLERVGYRDIAVRLGSEKSTEDYLSTLS